MEDVNEGKGGGDLNKNKIYDWLENDGFYQWQGKSIWKRYQTNIYIDFLLTGEIEIYTFPKSGTPFKSIYKDLTEDVLKQEVNKLFSFGV